MHDNVPMKIHVFKNR